MKSSLLSGISVAIIKRMVPAAALAISIPVLAQAQADLTISQAVLIAPTQGGTGTIRITTTNVGTTASTDFLVIGAVFTPATLNAISGPTASCAKGRNAVYTCALPGLAPGASADLTMTVKVGTGASFTSSTQSSGGSDSNLTNNVSSLVVPILPAAPDVQISGSASTGSPAAGAQFDYRFQVKVSGSAAATGVNLSDALPAELTLVSATASNGTPCTFADSVVQCALGDMPAGSQVLVTISVTAPPSPGVAVANTATAFAAAGTDAQPGNNTVTVNVTTR